MHDAGNEKIGHENSDHVCVYMENCNKIKDKKEIFPYNVALCFMFCVCVMWVKLDLARDLF